MAAFERPEELINYYAKSWIASRNIASAAGFLALLWSTVVLLGGFISILRIKDFWCLSVLSLLMVSQLLLLEMNVRTALDYVADMHILRLTMGRINLIRGGSRIKHWAIILIVCIGLVVKIILAICIALPLAWLGPYVALALPAARLIQRDYADAGVGDASKAKLNAALIIFYVLVMIHSLSVFYWAFLGEFLVRPNPWLLVTKQLGFGVWGPKIVRKYQFATTAKCSKDGVLPNKWNLLTFSVELLESASLDNRLWGARVLDTFIGTGIPIRQELLSSSQAIQNLINAIGLTSTDNLEIIERAARIVADLASEVRITQFPDALRCICCLLQSCNQYSEPEFAHPFLGKKVVELPQRKSLVQIIRVIIQMNNNNSRWTWTEWDSYFGDEYEYSYVSKGTKELISQGMLILEGLTQDEENCIEIIRHESLLSKVTLPLSYQDFLSSGCDHTWVEILGRSLTVVSRLISARPGEDTTRLCRYILCNSVAIRNLMRILEVDREAAFSEIREQAIEIIREVASDDSFRNLAFDESTSMMQMFVKTLCRIFLEDNDNNAIVAKQDEEKDKRVKRKAGEALSRLLRIPSERENTGAFISTKNVNAGDLLHKQDVINMFTKVVNQILSSKGEKAADMATLASATNNNCPVQSQPPKNPSKRLSSTQEDEEQAEESKMLAAMLSLAVAICNKNVITGDDFTRAIPDEATLMKKLKEIVMFQNATTEVWRILKLVCQLVITMAELKPSCIREFNGHNFKEALSKAPETMSDIDSCMIFAGNDRQVTARSLASLVKEAEELLAQEHDDIPA